MASIILIRHGQASFGAANYDQLSGLGRRQAQLLNDYFSDCGITLDAIYCGTLARQRQTAEIATKNQLAETPFHIDPRFNEIRNDEQFEFLLPELIQRNPSVAKLVEEAKSDSKSYQKVLEQVFQLWVSSESDDSGIQSWRDYSDQVEDAMKDLIKREGSGKNIGLFTSGGTIATIVSQVLGLDGRFAYRFYEPVINASMTRLLYNQEKVSLSSFNDHSFLEWESGKQGNYMISYR